AFYFDLQKGQPRLATPGFVRALELLRRLQGCRPEGDAAEPWKAFRDGKAVLCLAHCRRLAAFQAADSPVRDKVGVCPVPGSVVWFTPGGEERHTDEEHVNRVPYLGAGACLLAVPRKGSQTEAAVSFVAEMGGPRVGDQVVLEPRWGGGAVRRSQAEREHWDA